jgi:hypothetical protein
LSMMPGRQPDRSPLRGLIEFLEDVDRERRGALLRAICNRLITTIAFRSKSRPAGEYRPDHSFREVFALLTLFIAQIAAVLVYVQKEPNFDSRIVMTYLVLAAIPIVGFLAVAFSYETVDQERRYSYARPIRRGSLGAFLIAICLAPVVAVSYYKEALPGQGTATLIESHPVRFKKSGTDGMAAEFEMELKGRATRSWHVHVALCGKTSDLWKISHLDGFRSADHKKPLTTLGPV